MSKIFKYTSFVFVWGLLSCGAPSSAGSADKASFISYNGKNRQTREANLYIVTDPDTDPATDPSLFNPDPNFVATEGDASRVDAVNGDGVWVGYSRKLSKYQAIKFLTTKELQRGQGATPQEAIDSLANPTGTGLRATKWSLAATDADGYYTDEQFNNPDNPEYYVWKDKLYQRKNVYRTGALSQYKYPFAMYDVNTIYAWNVGNPLLPAGDPSKDPDPADQTIFYKNWTEIFSN